MKSNIRSKKKRYLFLMTITITAFIMATLMISDNPLNSVVLAADIEGVVGDGATDDGPAIQEFIDELPIVGANLDSYGAIVGVLPSLRSNGELATYRIATRIVIPAGVALHLTSDGPHGARLLNDTGTDYLLESENSSIGAILTISNLTFEDGGHVIYGSFRGQMLHRDCKFIDTSGAAIAYEDVSSSAGMFGVVFQRVNGCQFVRCATGIKYASGTAQVASVVDCNFLYNRGPAINIGATLTGKTAQDIHIVRCNFESCEEDTTIGNILIAEPADNDSPNRVFIQDCRFGPEVATIEEVDYDVPKHNIAIGKTTHPGVGTDEGPDQWAIEIEITSCEFLGRSGGPIEDHGESAIAFYGRPYGCSLTGMNIFRQYGVALITEPWSPTGGSGVKNYVYPYNQMGTPTPLFETDKGDTWNLID